MQRIIKQHMSNLHSHGHTIMWLTINMAQDEDYVWLGAIMIDVNGRLIDVVVDNNRKKHKYVLLGLKWK